MKIKNILVYLEPHSVVEPISHFTINLAIFYQARLFALSVVKRPSLAIKSRTDENAWRRLYEIEEDAFQADIKISLLLEEIEQVNRHQISQKIISIIKSFNIDMLVLYNNAKINIKDLTSGAQVPIIIYPLEIKE